MLVRTKYSIGDRLWFLANQELQCEEVEGVLTSTNAEGTESVYVMPFMANGHTYKANVPEQKCFTSKEELLNDLNERFLTSIDKKFS